MLHGEAIECEEALGARSAAGAVLSGADESVLVVLSFFVPLQDRLEEVALRDEEGVRPHRHRLELLLERLSLSEDVHHGARTCYLGCGCLAIFFACTCCGEGLHGLVSRAPPWFSTLCAISAV